MAEPRWWPVREGHGAVSNASPNDRVKIAVGKWVELVVVNDGGRVRVWLDGISLFDLPGVWADASDGSLALAVELGVVEVKEWIAFDP